MFFLHVGMHKTGTTFLQNDVFPHLRGIRYVPPWSSYDHFLRFDDSMDYLISNERLAGWLWDEPEMCECSLRRLSGIYPGAKVMIGFRRHQEFIVSAYKQYLREGGTLRFDEYFDPLEDQGFMTSGSFIYRHKVEWIRKYFKTEPFVYDASELRRNLDDFVRVLLAFLGNGVTLDTPVRSRVRNRGIKLYQAPVLRYLNRYKKSYLNPGGRFRFRGRFSSALELNPRGVSQYWLSFLPDGDFWQGDQETQVAAYYREDWAFVESCISARGAAIANQFDLVPAEAANT